MYQTILAALDGSDYSLYGAELALKLAKASGGRVIACHIYSAKLHRDRFMDMEPGLGGEYQNHKILGDLRSGHDSLITDGLVALSQGYLDRFMASATEAGVEAVSLNLEGRNYVQLLKAARDHEAGLITLGAHGLGDIGDGRLGSTAGRVMRLAGCDVLIARNQVKGGNLAVGIDGSPQALAALSTGAAWAKALGAGLDLLAAYDREFHQHIFKAMASTLTPERMGEVGLDRQEALHTQIIDDGLGALYQSFLDAALANVSDNGLDCTSQLLVGKAYDALLQRLKQGGIDLLVMGRKGHHSEAMETLGSNALALAELAPINVLLSSAPGEEARQKDLHWSPEAQARLERIPAGPRTMARRAVEDYVRGQGRDMVQAEDIAAVARRFGMGT
jgi:nucleotide-binding universal stress UspA family protein